MKSNNYSPVNDLSFDQFKNAETSWGDSGLNKLKPGKFGTTFETLIKKTGEETTYPVVVKVIRYEDHLKEAVDNEVQMLDRASRDYPLYMLQFFDCAHDPDSKTVLILTEKLDFDLGSEEFKSKKKHWNYQFYTGAFLMAATGLKNFHLTGYAHNDIQPENLMLLGSIPPIIKLIDFGFTMKSGVKKSAGSHNYKDPVSWSSGISRYGDTYSLGMTFFTILYDKVHGVVLTARTNIKDPSEREDFYGHRLAVVNQEFKTKEEELEKKGLQEDLKVLKALHEVIRGMLQNTHFSRTKLPTVILELRKILEPFEDYHDYLSENSEEFYNEIYNEEKLKRELFWHPQLDGVDEDNLSEEELAQIVPTVYQREIDLGSSYAGYREKEDGTFTFDLGSRFYDSLPSWKKNLII